MTGFLGTMILLAVGMVLFQLRWSNWLNNPDIVDEQLHDKEAMHIYD